MGRPGTSKELQEIEEAIRHEQNADELLITLSRLVEVAEHSAAYAKIDAGRMIQLAEYLAEIRYLLDTFSGAAARRGVSRLAKDVAERYRDLEGRIKELRNDSMAGRKVAG